jgi:hypothetical protein
MSQPLLTPTSRGMPQAPGRAPHSVALRASGATDEAPQRCPVAETLLARGTTPGPPRLSPGPPTCAPPARRPARGADERSMMT